MWGTQNFPRQDVVTQSHVCSGTPRKDPSHASQLLPAQPRLSSQLPAADSAPVCAMGMNPGCHSSFPTAPEAVTRSVTLSQPSRGSSSASLAFPAATNPACPHFPALTLLALIPPCSRGSNKCLTQVHAGAAAPSQPRSAPGVSPSPRPCRVPAAGTATCPAPLGSPSGAGRCWHQLQGFVTPGLGTQPGLSSAGATRIPQPANPAGSHPGSHPEIRGAPTEQG